MNANTESNYKEEIFNLKLALTMVVDRKEDAGGVYYQPKAIGAFDQKTSEFLDKINYGGIILKRRRS